MWRYLILLFVPIVITSCGDGSDDKKKDDFDRSAVLTHWADNIIIPAWSQYGDNVNALDAAFDQFNGDKNLDNFISFQNQFVETYKAWQHVSPYNIGKAEEISIRNYANIYPCDVEGLEENIQLASVNLELPSNFDKQGFPAIDYLLFGKNTTIQASFDFFSSADNNQYLVHLEQLIDQLVAKSAEVVNSWDSYRASFISNSGSTATSSVNKLLNDYVFYYEKFLRAGKIGIPVGVFSVNPFPDKVEAFYKRDISKVLLKEALSEVRLFVHGAKKDESTPTHSLESYMIYLKDLNKSADLHLQILAQLDVIDQAVESLPDDFYIGIKENPTIFLNTYDEMQKLVALLKVELFQLIDVKVDYVDADGD